MNSPGSEPFLRVTLPDIPLDKEEIATAILLECDPSGWETVEDHGRLQFIAYLPARSFGSADLNRLIATLRKASLISSADGVVVGPAEDVDWVANFREHFRPRRVGPFFITLDEPEPATDEGAIRLFCHPGQAFGTGTHESTCLALELLPQALPARSALDLGTGSGILTVAARLLGVPEMIAIDNDGTIRDNYARNLRANRITSGTQLIIGTIQTVTEFRFPLVLANIDTRAHHEFMNDYVALLESGGRIILSGVLREELGDLESKAQSAGLQILKRAFQNDWGALLMRLGEKR